MLLWQKGRCKREMLVQVVFVWLAHLHSIMIYVNKCWKDSIIVILATYFCVWLQPYCAVSFTMIEVIEFFECDVKWFYFRQCFSYTAHYFWKVFAGYKGIKP